MLNFIFGSGDQNKQDGSTGQAPPAQQQQDGRTNSTPAPDRQSQQEQAPQQQSATTTNPLNLRLPPTLPSTFSAESCFPPPFSGGVHPMGSPCNGPLHPTSSHGSSVGSSVGSVRHDPNSVANSFLTSLGYHPTMLMGASDMMTPMSAAGPLGSPMGSPFHGISAVNPSPDASPMSGWGSASPIPGPMQGLVLVGDRFAQARPGAFPHRNHQFPDIMSPSNMSLPLGPSTPCSPLDSPTGNTPGGSTAFHPRRAYPPTPVSTPVDSTTPVVLNDDVGLFFNRGNPPLPPLPNNRSSVAVPGASVPRDSVGSTILPRESMLSCQASADTMLPLPAHAMNGSDNRYAPGQSPLDSPSNSTSQHNTMTNGPNQQLPFANSNPSNFFRSSTNLSAVSSMSTTNGFGGGNRVVNGSCGGGPGVNSNSFNDMPFDTPLSVNGDGSTAVGFPVMNTPMGNCGTPMGVMNTPLGGPVSSPGGSPSGDMATALDGMVKSLLETPVNGGPGTGAKGSGAGGGGAMNSGGNTGNSGNGCSNQKGSFLSGPEMSPTTNLSAFANFPLPFADAGNNSPFGIGHTYSVCSSASATLDAMTPMGATPSNHALFPSISMSSMGSSGNSLSHGLPHNNPMGHGGQKGHNSSIPENRPFGAAIRDQQLAQHNKPIGDHSDQNQQHLRASWLSVATGTPASQTQTSSVGGEDQRGSVNGYHPPALPSTLPAKVGGGKGAGFVVKGSSSKESNASRGRSTSKTSAKSNSKCEKGGKRTDRIGSSSSHSSSHKAAGAGVVQDTYYSGTGKGAAPDKNTSAWATRSKKTWSVGHEGAIQESSDLSPCDEGSTRLEDTPEKDRMGGETGLDTPPPLPQTMGSNRNVPPSSLVPPPRENPPMPPFRGVESMPPFGMDFDPLMGLPPMGPPGGHPFGPSAYMGAFDAGIGGPFGPFGQLPAGMEGMMGLPDFPFSGFGGDLGFGADLGFGGGPMGHGGPPGFGKADLVNAQMFDVPGLLPGPMGGMGGPGGGPMPPLPPDVFGELNDFAPLPPLPPTPGLAERERERKELNWREQNWEQNFGGGKTTKGKDGYSAGKSGGFSGKGGKGNGGKGSFEAEGKNGGGKNSGKHDSYGKNGKESYGGKNGGKHFENNGKNGGGHGGDKDGKGKGKNGGRAGNDYAPHAGYFGKGQNENVPADASKMLYEFRTSNKLFSLEEILPHITEFSRDQFGSRLIQHKLSNAGFAEKDLVFEAILADAKTLITDPFANYVLQKFFEVGTTRQRVNLAKAIKGSVLELSLHVFGCWVMQRAIEYLAVPCPSGDTSMEAEGRKYQILLAEELEDMVLKLVLNQNGNHVIQKCIECLPAEKTRFIISAFSQPGEAQKLARHTYGCRVLQRLIEHSAVDQLRPVIEQLYADVAKLAKDEYGNYVVQSIAERTDSPFRPKVIDTIIDKIPELAVDKFASNVAERALIHSSVDDRSRIIERVISNERPFLGMVEDRYANFFIQKVIDHADKKQRKVIANVLCPRLHELKMITYAKHIIASLVKCGIIDQDGTCLIKD